MLMRSFPDAHWSEFLVSVGEIPVETPLGVDLDWLVQSDSFFGDCDDLYLVMSFLVTAEHDLHTVSNKLLCLISCQVFSPSILHQYLTVML